jgi:hypothetical protein
MKYQIDLQGKRFGAQTYTDKVEAIKALSNMFMNAERRHEIALKAGDFKTANQLHRMLRMLRSGLTIVPVKLELVKTEKATNDAHSNTPKRYQRLSSIHRKYAEV